MGRILKFCERYLPLGGMVSTQYHYGWHRGPGQGELRGAWLLEISLAGHAAAGGGGSERCSGGPCSYPFVPVGVVGA